jgi:hypothetical protein
VSSRNLECWAIRLRQKRLSHQDLLVLHIARRLKVSCTKYFRAITASTVLVCGVNPYWFLHIRLFEYIWYIFLFICIFSRSLAAVLIKLIGRYFKTSSHVCFPGLPIGNVFALFHILGKQTVLKHSLHIAVVDLGNKLKARWRLSLVTPS